jgi:hypothetical protein
MATDKPKAASKPRTEAQREASRRNGAKSRGPVTEAGRRRSAGNAMRHGLLARKLMPPGDHREHDRLYFKVRTSLVNEFEPRTFTETALVDALAMDFVQLTRCRQMIEELFRPPELPELEMRTWRSAKLADREIKLIDRVAGEIDAGDPPNLTRRQAERLAKLIAALVIDIEQEIADLQAGEIEPDDEEDAQLAALMQLIRPMRRRLQDSDHLAAVLSGNAVPARGELSRIRGLLRSLRDAAESRSIPGQPFDRRLEGLDRVHLRGLAEDPQSLLLLSTYERRIEQSIARRTAQLHR